MTHAEASTPDNIEYIKVEKKKILINQYQNITIKLIDSTHVTHIQMSYKRPDGNYGTAQLYRNSLGEFEGRTFPSPAGEYTVANIMVFKQVGVAIYEDYSEGGYYEFDEWNFTSYSADTTGPELDNLYVDNSSVIQNGNVTVTVEAHDDLSDIQTMYLDYKTPTGYYYQLPATNVGNNQFQVRIPSFMTSGLFIGQFECVGVSIRDSYNNTSNYYDYDYYSNRNLDSGNFTVKPEGDAPVLKNISIDKGEVNSEESLKVLAEVEDASGVANVNVNFTSPIGYRISIALTHAYGNMYEGEIPSYYTGLDSGIWKVDYVWVDDIYQNSQYIWSNVDYWWGQDLSGGDFVVKEKDRTPPERPQLNDVYDFSTVISGWAEPYSTIDVYADGGWLGSTTVYEGGYFYFDMPAQKAGTYIAVTSTDSSGNGSEQAVLHVWDGTPPGAPEVESVSDADTVIYGQAEPDSTIYVSAGNTMIAVAVADEKGSFSGEIPKQTAGTKLEFKALDAAGNMSDTREVTVIDGTPPNLPVVDEVSDASTKVTGTAEADAIVTIFQGTAEIGKGQADNNGHYSLDIPKQPAGTKLDITATDNSGNTSGKKQVSVIDKTAPSVPIVNEVTDKLITVTGKAEAHSIVTVKKGTAVIGNANATATGDFAISIGKQPAGVTLSVVAADAAGNVSKAKEVIVKDKTAPNAPNVQTVTDVSISITGTAEIGSSITVQAGTELIGSALADSNGKYSIAVSKLTSGMKLQITATDAAGNISEAKEVEVVDTTAPSAPIVSEVTDQSTAVSGKAEAGAMVHVKLGTATLGKAATDAKGDYSVPISKQKAGTLLSVTAIDLAGNTSPVVEVTIKDVTAPASPSVDEVTDQSVNVSGSAEAGSVVKVLQGENVLGKSTATPEGKYSVTISKQKAGIVLKVQSVDAAGNASEAKVVTVADVTAPASPTVKEVTDQTTSLSGTAEIGTEVTAKAGQTILGTGLVGSDGTYSITIAKQKAGTIISLVSIDKAGNSSLERKVTVKDITAPAAPSVNEVTDQSVTVSGKAEAGTEITIKDGDHVLGKVTATPEGTYSVAIPLQKAGIVLKVQSVDAAGNASAVKEITVLDATAPGSPTVKEVNDQTTVITGIAEIGSNVIVKAGQTTLGTGVAGSDSTYSITIAKQKAGIMLSVISVDAAGNISQETKKTVKDITAPAAPVVNKVTDQSTSIAGTAEPGSTVFVKSGTVILGKGTADEKGNYTIVIAKQTMGKALSITSVDTSGNTSIAKEITVTDGTAPNVPTVSEATDKTVKLSGTAEVGSLVQVRAGTAVIGKVTASLKGTYELTISKQKAGTKLIVTATDQAGNISPQKVITVKDVTAPAVPTVSPVDDNDVVIIGKAETNAKVYAYIGSKKIGEAPAKNGSYSIKIAKQKAGISISLHAIDAVGNKSGIKTIKVLDKTAPAIPSISAVADNSTVITGKAETAAVVYAYANNKKIGEAIAKNGAYSIKIAKQKAGITISVYAVDPAKNKSGSRTIKVADKTAPIAPTVNNVTSKSTVVSGKGEKAASVFIYNGTKKIGQGTVDSKGYFKVKISFQKKGSSLKVYLQDKAGNKSGSKMVKVY